jgi:homoserine O-acetyltransferase
MRKDSIFAIGFRRRIGALAMAAVSTFAVTAQAETQIFTLYDFQFEDGTIMPELRIAYETQGTLDAARDNAIVLLHGAIADRHAFDGLIGPGKLFDTDRYFVIAPDAIGGGESSSPSDGQGQDFPRYTIRDIMTADDALVARGLGLTQLHAIVGRSMGAFIGLEWAIHHPEMPKNLVLMAPVARSDANYRVVIDGMLAAVALDPEWAGGRYEHNPIEGLRHAALIYYPWTVSTAYLDRTAPPVLAQKMAAAAKSFADWDANALVLRYAACREHNVAAAYGNNLDEALALATMPVLVMASASDRLTDAAGTRHLAEALPHASYVEIPTDLGHAAIAAPPGSPAGDFIERTVRGFLK